MDRLRATAEAVRPPTVPSLLAALLFATIVVVTQSDHGTTDVGLGVHWYEYYPFYEHRHTDAVEPPLALAIYANLVAVAALVAPAVIAVERVVGHELRDHVPDLRWTTAAITLGAVGVLGVALLGGRTALWSLTALTIALLRTAGIDAVLEVPAWEMSAQSTTPAAALVLCALYGVTRAGQRATAAAGIAGSTESDGE